MSPKNYRIFTAFKHATQKCIPLCSGRGTGDENSSFILHVEVHFKYNFKRTQDPITDNLFQNEWVN